MYEQPYPPSKIFRLLGVAAVGTLLAVVVGIAVISSGRFDPLTRDFPQVDPSPYILTAAPEQRIVRWTEYPVPAVGQLRIVAGWHDGTRDLSYGLLLGDEAGTLEVSASPSGQLSVSRSNDGTEEVLFPPQPWPHLALGARANEFEVVINDDLVSVWINQELAWEGVVEVPSGDLGLFAETRSDAGSVRFSEISVLTID